MIKKLCQLALVVVLVAGAAGAWPAPVAGQSDLALFVTAVRTDAFPEIQVDFRAVGGNSQVVNNLAKTALSVTEGGTPVKDFELELNNNGGIQLVFVLDLDVYNSYTYQPGITEMQSVFTTLVTGGHFIDDRDSVRVVGRINRNSDQTVELVPTTRKGLDLTKWAQGFDFKGGTQYTNGLLGVDEMTKELASAPNVGAQTTAIIYVGRRIATLPAAVAASAATGYAQAAKDARILLYAFHTGGPNDSQGALNTLANGSGGAYVQLQRGSVATAVGGVYGSLNAQRTLYTVKYRTASSASGKREIKLSPAGAATNSPQTVTASYDIQVESPIVKITDPAVGARINRTPGTATQKVTVTAEVQSWPDGHPRQLKTAVLTVNGKMTAQLNQPTREGIYEFEWDISSITQPGEHAMDLKVTVTDELGLQATDSALVGVAVAELPATEAPTPKPGDTPAPTARPTATPPPDGGVPWMIVGLGVGLFVLMLIAIVVLVVVVLRMRRPAAAAAPAARPAEETGSETILVEGARPQVTLAQIRILHGPPDMMGRTIDITRTATVLGRAPQGADIVFFADDDRSVISRRHCTLDTDGVTFTITDHSANGTSVNGARLQRDVPTLLEDGSEVTLGGAGDQLGVRFTFANMIGKTQMWTPGMAMGGGRPVDEGATILKGADLMAGRPSAARPPAGAPPARGGIAPWMIIVGVAAVLVLLVACGGIIAVVWYLTSSGRQMPLGLMDPVLMAALARMAGLPAG